MSDSLAIQTSARYECKYHKDTTGWEHKILMRVFHCRRSGGHGIINWIMSAFPAPRLWGNNISVFQRTAKVNLLEGTKTSLALVSWEDPNRNLPLEESLLRIRGICYGEARTEHQICIIRDCYNHIASRIKSNRLGREPPVQGYHGEIDIRMWKEQALWCIAHPGQVINYNLWLTDETYRQLLIDRYKIPSKGDRNLVSSLGRGSSFDGTNPPNAGKLLKRYEQVSLPKSVLQSQEIAQLNRAIFGFDLL